AEMVAFAPDIVALIGTAEAHTKVLKPLEEQWTFDAGAGQSRPYYVLTDSTKVKEVTEFVASLGANGEQLRSRIRGTGVVTPPASVGVFNAFTGAYASQYGSYPGISG